jgi:hypothetical protein
MLGPAALADKTIAVVIRETALIAWGWRLGFANRPVPIPVAETDGHRVVGLATLAVRLPLMTRRRQNCCDCTRCITHSPRFAGIWIALLALTLRVAYQIAHRKKTTLQVLAPAPRPFAVAPRGRSPLPRTGRPLPRAGERWLRIEGAWEHSGSAKYRSLSTNRTETSLHDL